MLVDFDYNKQYLFNDNSTYAIKRFLVTFSRIEKLLEIGLAGIKKYNEKMMAYVDKSKVPQELTEKDITYFNENIDFIEKDGKKYVDINDSINWDRLLYGVVSKAITINQELNNFTYSILLTFGWSNFETYFLMLYEELFKKYPQMLKSKTKNINYEDLIENIEKPLSLIVEKELDRIGHFKLKDLINHLDDTLNFKFDKNNEDILKDIYLLRNIIVHNTGIVRPNIRKLLPDEVQLTDDNELIIKKDYFKNLLSVLEKSVFEVEDYIRDKFS